MKYPQICRIVQLTILIVAVWATAGTMVFAKDAPGVSSAGEGYGAWVWAYMIVLLLVSLGMITVCKSSNRRVTAKPEVYEAPKKTLL